MEGKIVKVVEEMHDEKVCIRLVTMRVPNPWPNNYYEEYTFRDESKRFVFGDTAKWGEA